MEIAFARYPQYPFLTEKEFEEMFGEGVLKGIRSLDRYADKVCSQCQGECCRWTRCSFYYERFPSCPIYEYRPPTCRLYFCSEVTKEVSTGKKELEERAKSLYGIIEEMGLAPAERPEKDWLSRYPKLKQKVDEIMGGTKSGALATENACPILVELVQDYRMGKI